MKSKKEEKSMSAGKKLENSLVSAALSVAAGISIAPKFGRKFYDEMKRRSAGFDTKIKSRASKVKRAGTEIKKSIKDAVA